MLYIQTGKSNAIAVFFIELRRFPDTGTSKWKAGLLVAFKRRHLNNSGGSCVRYAAIYSVVIQDIDDLWRR